jgi:hypothetical protein
MGRQENDTRTQAGIYNIHKPIWDEPIKKPRQDQIRLLPGLMTLKR